MIWILIGGLLVIMLILAILCPYKADIKPCDCGGTMTDNMGACTNYWKCDTCLREFDNE